MQGFFRFSRGKSSRKTFFAVLFSVSMGCMLPDGFFFHLSVGYLGLRMEFLRETFLRKARAPLAPGVQCIKQTWEEADHS